MITDTASAVAEPPIELELTLEELDAILEIDVVDSVPPNPNSTLN